MSGSGRPTSGLRAGGLFALRGSDRCLVRKHLPLLYETVPFRFEFSISPDGMQELCEHNHLRLQGFEDLRFSVLKVLRALPQILRWENLSTPRSRSLRRRSLTGIERAEIQPEQAPGGGGGLRRAPPTSWPKPLPTKVSCKPCQSLRCQPLGSQRRANPTGLP
jgi:hypothetical protein